MRYTYFVCALLLLCSFGFSDFLKDIEKKPMGLGSKISILSATISPKVLRLALKGYANIQGKSSPKEKYLAIVDFSISSTKKRFYLISMKDSTLVHTDYVAHGKHSGDVYANSFSNTEKSLKTSLGFYKIAESYTGKHGLSLRLDGLDCGYNDNARTRAIVMHAADYAKPAVIKIIGRLGKSFGCPALPPTGFALIAKQLKKNAILFHYYPDEKYLKNCVWLH
jgi:L,D-transpeptidase catalytic domain